MAFEPESLGLSPAGLPLLRDLIHERTGLYYDNGRFDSFTDRIAPLVLERGFRSFLDFYYLLKYEEHAPGGEWRRVMDALRQRRVHLHGLLLVPAVTCGSAGCVPAVRESD